MSASYRGTNAEGVPSENSQRHSLEQYMALALILKSNDDPDLRKNLIVDFPLAPDVSTSTCRKVKRRTNTAYFVIFLTSDASATDSAASAARTRFEDANVLTHVAS